MEARVTESPRALLWKMTPVGAVASGLSWENSHRASALAVLARKADASSAAGCFREVASSGRRVGLESSYRWKSCCAPRKFLYFFESQFLHLLLRIKLGDRTCKSLAWANHIDAQEILVSLPFSRKGKEWRRYDGLAVQAFSVPAAHGLLLLLELLLIKAG